ncbi:uncharacterized protein C8A04DRAFT_15519 [Dichotomopilus funicola]|uniref:Uncharacterized protein n=1 Tax=Dichotomopilus funicola TaxID=1934379 RepID=A0AAN6UWH2_9PEZI|nr:hypothetical protein C8A04DRAFT_15519 [Dichotomopilus funicola]
MIFATALVASLPLLTAAHSTPHPQLPRQSNPDPDPQLLPWQVTTLTTHAPSGRPGNPPYSVLFVNITDPNTIPVPFNGTSMGSPISFPPLSAACVLRWNGYVSLDTYPEEDPFGRVTDCTVGPAAVNLATAGRWTVTVGKQNETGYGPSATRDFTLTFGLEESMMVEQGIVSVRYEGTGSFAVGENLGLECGGSGTCNVWLNETVVEVEQKLVATTCLSGKCLEEGE